MSEPEHERASSIVGAIDAGGTTQTVDFSSV